MPDFPKNVTALENSTSVAFQCKVMLADLAVHLMWVRGRPSSMLSDEDRIEVTTIWKLFVPVEAICGSAVGGKVVGNVRMDLCFYRIYIYFMWAFMVMVDDKRSNNLTELT